MNKSTSNSKLETNLCVTLRGFAHMFYNINILIKALKSQRECLNRISNPLVHLCLTRW